MTHDPGQLRPTISTHVLDAEHGQPAEGVLVTLYRMSEDGRPQRIAQALTDTDGRVRDLLERPLVAGDYRLEFELAGERAAGTGDPERFFRRLAVDLRIRDIGRSYHVPILLGTYAMTTYRGS